MNETRRMVSDMQLNRLRITVRSMMNAIAILAVSWCMLLGIADLIVYADPARLERRSREGAVIWEAKHETGHARAARELARNLSGMVFCRHPEGLSTG